jgi:hypothetical protein
MKRAVYVCLALAVALAASPAFAGTVYVPILADNGLDGTDYVTRIWLTNEGNGPQTVETLFLPNLTDGTKDRESGKKVEKTTVRAGDTVVIEVKKGSGLLEITTGGNDPGALAISAELRNSKQSGAKETHSVVPVMSSANVAAAGETLTLQGLRRTEGGVYTNLVLVNLGHDGAQCSVKALKASGQQLASTALLSLVPLSQVQYSDALRLLGELQIKDVHAQIQCDQPFFAYLGLYENKGGEALLIEPSATGDSELARPGDGAPSVPGALVFSKSGTFHTPTPGNATAVFNIPVPKNHTYSKVVVDVEIFNGGWSSKPAGFHNLLWLHRGACCWPKWPDNVFGLVEARGPGLNRVAVKTNVNLGAHEQLNFFRVVPLLEGNTYQFHYEYDGAGRAIRFVISQGGQVVGQGSNSATANSVQTDGSGFFMIYFGHEPSEFDEPTYGWKYQNLRVEFFP